MTALVLILSLLQGLTLRGTVFEGTNKPAANATVTLVGSKETLKIVSGPDGTFAFSGLQPGSYQLSAQLGRSSGLPTTMYVGHDMDGVGIVLKPQVNPIVFGSIKMEGDDPLPTPLPKIVIKYPSGTVLGRFNIDRRGLFFFAVSASECMISLEDLKDPYFVKSIAAGEVDLTKNPLKLTDASITNAIVITLGVRK